MKPKQAELEVTLKLAGFDTRNLKLYQKCKKYGQGFSSVHTEPAEVWLVRERSYGKFGVDKETVVIKPCTAHLPMFLKFGFKELW